MSEAKTLGQLADEGAPLCEAFDLVARLAETRGWLPIGFRRIDLSDHLVVTVNGTNDEREDHIGFMVPPFYASVEHNGWPVGVFGMFDGTLIAGIEERLIAALTRALKEPPSDGAVAKGR